MSGPGSPSTDAHQRPAAVRLAPLASPPALAGSPADSADGPSVESTPTPLMGVMSPLGESQLDPSASRTRSRSGKRERRPSNALQRAQFLTNFVPRQVLLDAAAESLALDREEPVLTPLSGAVGFFDVSGFSKLSEELRKSEATAASRRRETFQVAQTSPVSASAASTDARTAVEGSASEELLGTLNSALAEVVDKIAARGGDVIKFAGDAVIVVWSTQWLHESLSMCAWRAAECARAALQTESCLGVHVGLGAGAATLVHVGGVKGRWETSVVGAPVLQAFDACDASSLGQVAVSDAFHRALLEPAPPQPGWTAALSRLDGRLDTFLLEGVGCDLPDTDQLSASAPHMSLALLEQYVPEPLLALSGYGAGASLRKVTVLFVRLADVTKEQVGTADEDKLRTLVRGLHARLRRVQELIQVHGATLRQFICDDKGVLCIAAIGPPPVFHSDGPKRGVSLGTALCDRYPVCVGIATGNAICGIIGSHTTRSEYSIVGDSVNLAARLMGKARLGDCVLCSRTLLEGADASVSAVATTETLTVKGKPQPITAHRVNAKALRRRSDGGTPLAVASAAHCVGRDRQLETLRRVQDGTVLLVEGGKGAGKSELLAQLPVDPAADLPLIGVGVESEKRTHYCVWRNIVAVLLELRVDLSSPAAMAAVLRLPEATARAPSGGGGGAAEGGTGRRLSTAIMGGLLGRGQAAAAAASVSPPPSAGRHSTGRQQLGSPGGSSSESGVEHWRTPAMGGARGSARQLPNQTAAAAKQQTGWSLRDNNPVVVDIGSLRNAPAQLVSRRVATAASSALVQFLIAHRRLSEPRDLPVLAAVLPRAGGVSGASAAPQVRATPRQVARVLTALLKLASSAARPVLVLDDVHYVDERSWAVLRLLAAALPTLRVVLGVRPDSLTLRSSRGFRDFSAWLEGTGRRRSVQLPPLSRYELHRLVAERLAVGTVDPSIVNVLFARSRGVPGAAVDHLHAMLQAEQVAVDGSGGALEAKVDLATANGDVAVTATQRADVTRRFDTLTHEAKFMASVLAVAGDVVPMPLLNYLVVVAQRVMHTALGVAAVGDVLDELVAAGLVELSPARDSVLFVASHVRHTTYRLVLHAHRQAIHGLVVSWALLGSSEQELAPQLEDLAYHCVCSKQWGRATLLFLQAAAERRATGNLAAALDLLKIVEDLLEDHGAEAVPSAGELVKLRSMHLVARAQCLIEDGLFVQAVSDLNAALEALQRAPTAAAAACVPWRWGWGWGWLRRFRRGRVADDGLPAPRPHLGIGEASPHSGSSGDSAISAVSAHGTPSSTHGRRGSRTRKVRDQIAPLAAVSERELVAQARRLHRHAARIVRLSQAAQEAATGARLPALRFSRRAGHAPAHAEVNSQSRRDYDHSMSAPVSHSGLSSAPRSAANSGGRGSSVSSRQSTPSTPEPPAQGAESRSPEVPLGLMSPLQG